MKYDTTGVSPTVFVSKKKKRGYSPENGSLSCKVPGFF
jgi:hypothetical protein